MIENIQVFTQNSIRIKNGEKKIYVDPFQMREEPRDADFILITHDHHDHFSPEDIAKVRKDSTLLIVPEAMLRKAEQESGFISNIYPVKPETFHEIEGLTFDTIPSYNNLKPFHPKSAGWIGYLLRINGKRIYIAGDTSLTKDAKEVKCDIALVPIGGTYTMDVKKAAELINIIRPEIAVPVHYGSIVGKKEDAETFRELVDDTIRVEILMQY